MTEFDPVIGYTEEKFELERICDIMRDPEKYKRLGVTTPRGLLIAGKPGLGKTLMAKCFINAGRRMAFTCRKDRPDGDFVGHIAKTFAEAKENAPSIVFLDDMDKFANEDNRHRNAEAFVAIQSCIDDCRDSEVFVLATANDLSCLPESLLRPGRFDKLIKVGSPKYEDAVEIVRHYLGQKRYVSDVDVEEITSILNGRSCAELETVINEAGIYAGFAGKESIEMDDIVKACLRVIFNAPEADNSERSFINEVAYHEAGHAVVHEILDPGTINLVSVATYNGNIGGVTSYSQDESYCMDKVFMENRVRAILGGKAAAELVFGKTDVGSNGDLRRAFSIVTRFVDNYCTYGFNMFQGEDTGAGLNDRRDIAVSVEMERFFMETKRILVENRDFLDAVAKELIEKKTILKKDIERIRKELNEKAA